MRKRLYLILMILFMSSLLVVGSNFTNEKIIDVKYSQLTKEAQRQVDCLADNIYHEAGYEPLDGKKAVAFVTLNRVQDPRYPKDICSVVKQKVRIEHIGDRSVVCQFSWFCENKQNPRGRNAYEEARDVAVFVYANYERLRDNTNGALFYHADYVRPNWKNLEKTVVIGRHIFYREKQPL